MRSTLLLLSLLIAAAAVLAIPAAAKDGVRAVLDEPVRLGTPPGKTIKVAWRLVDENGRAFGASGIYLRVSRCGRAPLNVPATERSRGGYSARVKVPKGGIRRLRVGLRGWRIIGDRKERADVFFPFDPTLERRCS
jgi:hypothetical protein